MSAKVIGARTRTLALLFLISCTIGSEGSRNMLQTTPPPVSGGSTASPSPPPTTVTAAAVTPPPTTVTAAAVTPPPPATVVAGTPPPPTTVVAGTPPPPVTARTPPPPVTARTPPPPSGQCKTAVYTFTYADYTCPSGGACGTGKYSNSSSPQSTQAKQDTLTGTFSSLTATLTGQSLNNPQYSPNYGGYYNQELFINGKSFGRFPALGLGGNSVIDCKNGCSTQGLVKGTQTGYVVGGTNTFSLPSTNGLNYVYPPTGEKIYTYYFTSMTVTVTTC